MEASPYNKLPNLGTPPWAKMKQEWMESIEKRFQEGEISREQADLGMLSL